LIEAGYKQREKGRGRRDCLTSSCQVEFRESITQSASFLLPVGSCCFCSRSSFWQKFNTAPTLKRRGEGRERGGESRIEEELPCPMLPLARSLTAASKKRIGKSKSAHSHSAAMPALLWFSYS